MIHQSGRVVFTPFRTRIGVMGARARLPGGIAGVHVQVGAFYRLSPGVPGTASRETALTAVIATQIFPEQSLFIIF